MCTGSWPNCAMRWLRHERCSFQLKSPFATFILATAVGASQGYPSSAEQGPQPSETALQAFLAEPRGELSWHAKLKL